MVKVITTSSDHELHLPTCTVDQAPIWSGYCQMPKKVLKFSASQMKKPISTNASSIGMRRSRSSGRNTTVVRAYTPSAQAAMYQR